MRSSAVRGNFSSGRRPLGSSSSVLKVPVVKAKQLPFPSVAEKKINTNTVPSPLCTRGFPGEANNKYIIILSLMSLIYFPDCDACRSKQGDCAKHKASHSSRKLHVPGQNEPVKLSYAIASFPEEVQLCVSSIPGAGCGVCAKQHIPVGTWIGPYEGKLVKCDEIKPTTDTSYMWEVLSYICVVLR